MLKETWTAHLVSVGTPFKRLISSGHFESGFRPSVAPLFHPLPHVRLKCPVFRPTQSRGTRRMSRSVFRALLKWTLFSLTQKTTGANVLQNPGNKMLQDESTPCLDVYGSCYVSGVAAAVALRPLWVFASQVRAFWLRVAVAAAAAVAQFRSTSLRRRWLQCT